MGVNPSELVVPFVGAIEASISVLLTIFFGVLTAQFNLLSTGAAKEVSRTCVRMFLPALLIVKVGSNLHQGTAIRYLPILIWAILYNGVSIGLGVIATRALKLPGWVTPALAFNNTTSLPLLLIQSLSTTGILDVIIRDGDTSTNALDRAESYFLINSMVSNSLTFALGPRLLRPNDEDAPEADNKHEEEDEDSEQENRGMERHSDGIIDEETSLLPQRVGRGANRVGKHGYKKAQRWWHNQPAWIQEVLDFVWQFANAPLLGAVTGAVLGLIPPLHRVFFSPRNQGGYLNSWMTSAIKNLGDLFASLQIIVVGVKLSQSLLKMKRGENSGEVSKSSLALITFVRFIVWPIISISTIWGLATKTELLDDDPMLWFAMMLMPTGPPAMILVALTDVNNSPESEKMAIAKFLTIMYAITPLICFAVVGSLKTSEAAMSA